MKKAFQSRVSLPGYNKNRYNASLALSGLRSSDSGLYRCEVVVGINDEQDTVPLEVTGGEQLLDLIPIRLDSLVCLVFVAYNTSKLSQSPNISKCHEEH